MDRCHIRQARLPIKLVSQIIAAGDVGEFSSPFSGQLLTINANGGYFQGECLGFDPFTTYTLLFELQADASQRPIYLRCLIRIQNFDENMGGFGFRFTDRGDDAGELLQTFLRQEMGLAQHLQD